MLTFGALTFVVPVALAGFLVLPVIWWLIRVTPPVPRRIAFPPIRFLFDLRSTEETADRCPRWLLLLRLLVATLIILGVARPVYLTDPAAMSDDPMLLIVDDGWASADRWSNVRAAASRTLDRAEREDRAVIILSTARRLPDSATPQLRSMTAAQARAEIAQMQPKPWSVDRSHAFQNLRQRLTAANVDAVEIVWLSDGLNGPAASMNAASLLDTYMRGLGPVAMIRPADTDLPVTLDVADVRADVFTIRLRRADARGARTVTVRAIDDAGLPLDVRSVVFQSGATEARLEMDLPSEWLARIEGFSISNQRTAASTLLVDSRWQRRTVGLVNTSAFESDQPLLSPNYYVTRALESVADLRTGDVASLLGRDLSVMIVTDIGVFDDAQANVVQQWVEAGGVLIRFANVRMAESVGFDGLVPARVRRGIRDIGGSFSWRGTGQIAEFMPGGPFQGLTAATDVTVRRQLLIETGSGQTVETWAALDDGTPLVSARQEGDGWLVLFHTSANAEWSNLSLSGLMLDMLARLVALGKESPDGEEPVTLMPERIMDGFGQLGAPPSGLRPVSSDHLQTIMPGPSHPPGFYGDGRVMRAINLASADLPMVPLGGLPRFVTVEDYDARSDWEARPWLLTAAAILILVDLFVSLFLRGLVPGFGSGARLPTGVVSAILMVSMAAMVPIPAKAGSDSQTIPPAALSTRLAYIASGNHDTDTVVRAGLEGLAFVVNSRTAVELDKPVAVDPTLDVLAFYPLLYWSIDEAAGPLTPKASRNLIAYMRNGGTIVFDVRSRQGGHRTGLRQLARSLDLPPLIPLPTDHVLRRAYYLMSDTPGRWTGDTVWIERTEANVNDGVTSVIAGNHDWVGAWALDDARRPLFAVVPGGERQREIAYRFGVNLVMHALTGNYKADQVHLPTIMERLGL